ncbi:MULTISPECIES: N-acetylmuramoyl-L-alanine amidase [Chryseobacterium]|uniref:N-acetylmuramoyl-L-alanine amidase n=1 Tax=Chryseobacterium camelliae TaxID=1265445 RepID=A0ABU0TJD5_9FLAO|nr:MULTISPECIES: N-acetylmuramoyl-L-alanine amidase [Chryseobacterium]MDT3408978.1 N-acetylmuramoyl-L-alanine amidase [Pseudacidovorax intermedius]MDQ1097165.1 N-acetylmuramoyl-L-alanine amidase [Chryseobacterium camelliae]MDQ1101102.1 N-acetylmuramoyl-L-alanine amidase [Chryseobacterium sp. SORGH_AS_1048]MDR6084545.1 N-acetylmuramoyl-L-alanine amidase [Chryseobacterium sp. SORGH_AS_0909]MDR6132814.1 N-acetylmuramoyl-L-alanine amidase [Chryseobacterium sp. SORGH_AS_1175]
MRKTLYIIGLSAVVFSCTSQQNVKKTAYKRKTPVTQAKTAVTTQPQAKPKPQITTDHGVEFYTTNIADITKNDNTISYGSIVSAKPAGYKVTKTYFPAIAQNFRQKYLILHYTALPEDKSITVLTQQAVSAHYLVNDKEDNQIYQLVDENKRAYHAGISSWRNDKNLNDTSIGIEIVNNGYTADSTARRIFVPFSEDQIKKVAALAKDIVTRYQIPPTNVLAHSDIAPTRKQDPGPMFPWKKLYDEYQIGMWYDEATKKTYYDLALVEFTTRYNEPAFIFMIQTALQKFGYGVEPSGKWDDATKKTIEAFQYHFRPQNYDGIMDAETWAILQALNVKYPRK